MKFKKKTNYDIYTTMPLHATRRYSGIVYNVRV